MKHHTSQIIFIEPGTIFKLEADGNYYIKTKEETFVDLVYGDVLKAKDLYEIILLSDNKQFTSMQIRSEK